MVSTLTYHQLYVYPTKDAVKVYHLFDLILASLYDNVFDYLPVHVADIKQWVALLYH